MNKSIDNIKVEKIKEIYFIYLIAEDYPNNSLKNFIDEQKIKYKQKCIALIISNNDNKISIVLGSSNDLIDKFDSSQYIKKISNILGGKGGGGRKDLAQGGGNDKTKINEAIDFIKKEISILF